MDLTAALLAARAESGAAEVLEADEIVEVGGPEAGPSTKSASEHSSARQPSALARDAACPISTE